MKFFVAIVALFAVAAASPLTRNAKVSGDLAAIIAAIQSPSTDPSTAYILEQYLENLLSGASPIGVGPAIVEPTPVNVADVEPIIIGAPIIDQFQPIAVGPAIIDFPVAVVEPTPVVVAPSPIVDPTPVVVAEPTPVATPEVSSAPLVQIILNINQAESAVPPVVAEVPVVVGDSVYEAPIRPTPVTVVEHAPEPEPVVIAPTPVVIAPTPVADIEPVIVGTPIFVDPVIVVDETPVIPDPVILPAPVAPVVVPEPVILPTPVLPEVVPAPVIDVEPVIVGTPVLPSPVVNLPETLN